MSAMSPAVPTPTEWTLPSRGRVGMYCLIVAEAAIFTIFVVAYIFYIGKSVSGPTPQQVLEVPIFYTVCLLSSSIVIHFAERALHRGQLGSFKLLWFLTFALGATFLVGRVAHAAGLSRHEGASVGRAIGVAATMLVLVAAALRLLWGALE